MPYPDLVSSAEPSPRPQSLMLTFFGIHVLGRDLAVSSGSVIDALSRVDVTEEAVRSTLTRMVGRGLLERHRQGRKMYFALTPRAVSVLQDGYDRIWQRGAANLDWDGQWTLVGFSLPEAWRRERHDLRSRLTWGGFGPLQNGLWVAPSDVDAAALLGDLGLDAHLRVFRGTVLKPTEVAAVLETAFDIGAIAADYQAFLQRWSQPGPGVPDPLGSQLLLHTDWLDLVRRDPHLPAGHLPADWPAIEAEELFHALAREREAAARAEAERTLDTLRLS
ncbi:PaaX family transcriptional regulator [Catenulispora pinisilvae]|uniref:PaaX family transcriptional regulator n=1 Tax=Catenulispora pinisilvae TaxID=2705253 RepID=UPI001892627A